MLCRATWLQGRSEEEGENVPKSLYCGVQGRNRWGRSSSLGLASLNISGFPGGSGGKESACNAEDLGLIPGLGKSLGREHDNPIQYSCLENPHGQRNLAGCCPWGRRVRHDWVTQHAACRGQTSWYLALEWVGSGRLVQCEEFSESQIKLIEMRTLDWLVCQWKACSQVSLLTISRKWLVLRGTVSPGSARPQMSKHQNKKRLNPNEETASRCTEQWGYDGDHFPEHLFYAWPLAMCFACVNSEPSELVMF